MKIQQVRKGFAHNSSSTHSIVFLKKGDTDILTSEDYHWDEFLLVSKEEKTKYFAAQFHQAIAQSIGPEAATVVTSGFFGYDGNASIDHQSVMEFPRLHDGSIATEFIREAFGSYIDSDKIGIAGGNDNGGDEIHVGRPDVPLSRYEGYGGSLVRKELDGTWTTFNMGSGNKVRYAPDFLANVRNKKASTPELVDIKITDYCSIGCSFCYQNSTVKGKHGSLSKYKELIDKLTELKVFEVAIGGGEPTQYPDFIEMLQYARSKKIVPNFTTKNPTWVASHQKDLEKIVGSFAVSCTTLEDLKKSRALLEDYRQASVYQFVAGVTPMKEFKKIIEYKKNNWFNLSLVGFKKTGRAPEPLPLDGIELYNLMKEDFDYVSVDVAFLQQYPNFDQAMTCDTQEGRHSMYVDLVEDKMAKSSYGGQIAPLDVNELNNFFLSL
jgi:organic radical activating enzyme